MRINKPTMWIVHHTGGTESNPLEDTSNHTFEMVNSWHRNNPNVWLGEYSSLGYAIGYHWFIDKTGKTTQGRAYGDEGAHCVGHNIDSLGVCLAGNFDVTLPTKEQEDALRNLLNGTNLPILPHRAFANKSCYGRKLGDTWASDLVKKIEPAICQPQKDEIVELKKKLTWYEALFKYIAEKWS